MDYNEHDQNKTKKKKEKKKRVIICVIIGIVIVAGAFALYNWQKNNITALWYAMNSSSDEIADQIEESDQRVRNRLSEITGIQMRSLTKEEAKLLADGEITQEEAVSLITGETTLEIIQSKKSESADKSSESGNESESGNDSAGNGSQSVDISSTLAKIYALEGEFTGSIESLISEGRANAGSMSAPELIRKYSGMAASLEGACDSRLESLISELESKLAASGGDKSIISEIRAEYQNKKSLKKAELMSKFGG